MRLVTTSKVINCFLPCSPSRHWSEHKSQSVGRLTKFSWYSRTKGRLDFLANCLSGQILCRTLAVYVRPPPDLDRSVCRTKRFPPSHACHTKHCLCSKHSFHAQLTISTSQCPLPGCNFRTRFAAFNLTSYGYFHAMHII
jgi:hypothetical protein